MSTITLRSPLVGEQRTNAITRGTGVYHAIHFCVMYPDRGQETVRVMVEDGTGYDTLEDAILSLPEPGDRSVEELRKQIATDYKFGLGEYYPEHGVVAKSNPYVFDRPFARYVAIDGKMKIVKHPFADLMVCRVKEETNV